MSTQISAALLTELRAEGRTMAAESGPFVDPTAVHRLEQLVRRRGEPWVAAILGHDLARRSRLRPDMPHFIEADMHTLFLADAMEDRVAFDGIVQQDDQ